MRIFDIVITLYDPKSTTWHVRTASRPTAAVTLAMGAENFGSVDRLTGENVSVKIRWKIVEMYVSSSYMVNQFCSDEALLYLLLLLLKSN